MSVHVLSWVLRRSEAKLGARLVLLVLADHAKDDGSAAWPAVDTIASEARMSRRAVQSALRTLEADGAIERLGESRHGTTIWRVVMGGADSARGGAESDTGGVQNPTNRGEAASPEPSLTVNGNRQKKIIDPADEPIGFSEWLGHHVLRADEDWDIERSVPRPSTSYRSELARTFAALVAEGYELEDFKLASDGVLADEFMRSGGHTAPENVLRKTKIAKRIDEGRAWRAAQENDKYARFG